MDTKRICSGCQKLLAPNAPDGLCPECLIKAGLGTGVDIGPDTQPESGRIPFVAPTLEEVARLFPQLEILGFIGQGGMGAVYKARQKALDRVVALKILPPGIGKDPAFAERFTREAKALARLNHPGVVTLYEFGQADGLFFFLMEFVDGVSLRHLLEVERISAREAMAIVPQICDALQYAHDQGIVHRDIKPENILLDRQGRVKVADFGLAKLVGQDRESAPSPETSLASTPALTESGKVMGTPQYMAPEQRKHPTEVDHRDIPFSVSRRWQLKEHPFDLRPGKHTVTMTFAVHPAKGESGDRLQVASNPVEIEIVGPAEEWGPAVEGVQCRVRAEKPTWPQGALPKLFADLRNQGKRNLRIALESESWEIEIDGKWHRPNNGFTGRRRYLPLAPGQEQPNLDVWILDVDNQGRRLRALEPGRHILRVARLIPEFGPGEDVLRLVSNPIEIEITAPPPDAGEDRPQDVVRGRVVDHEGNPVAGAAVYLAGSQALEWERIEAWQGKPPSVSGPTAQTGPQGGFALGVAGTPKNRLVIASPSLAVWVVPLPEPGTEPTIRLPAPATLKIRCDIPGAGGQAQFHLHLKTWQMEGWKGLTDGRQYVSVPVPNPGQIVLSNLTPGTYDLARQKNVRVGDYGMGLFCNARDATLDGGQTVEAALVRGAGQPILGQVVGLKGTDVAGAFLFVKTAAATGDPRKERGLHLFDVQTCDVEGQFKTETLPPGDYTVVAEAYGPDMLFSGERLPDHVGAAKATVRAEGPPPQVRIEMKTRAEFDKAAAGSQAPPEPARRVP
jgi:predicted Ser/Thr protein kinase